MVDWINKVTAALFNNEPSVAPEKIVEEVEAVDAAHALNQAAGKLDALAKKAVNQRSIQKQELKRVRGEIERYTHRIKKARDEQARLECKKELDSFKDRLQLAERLISDLVVYRESAEDASRDLHMLGRVYAPLIKEEPEVAAPLDQHFMEVAQSMVRKYHRRFDALFRARETVLQDNPQVWQRLDSTLIDAFLRDYRASRVAQIANFEHIDTGTAARITTNAIICRKALESTYQTYVDQAQSWSRRAEMGKRKEKVQLLDAQARIEQYEKYQAKCREVLAIQMEIADAYKECYDIILSDSPAEAG